MTVRYPPIERTNLTRLSEGAERNPWLSEMGYRERRPSGLTIDTTVTHRSASATSTQVLRSQDRIEPAQPYGLKRVQAREGGGAGAPEAEASKRGPAGLRGWWRRAWAGVRGKGFKRLDKRQPS